MNIESDKINLILEVVNKCIVVKKDKIKVLSFLCFFNVFVIHSRKKEVRV